MKTLLLGANGQLGRSFVEDGGLAARGELVVSSRDGTLSGGHTGERADLAEPAGLLALLDRAKPQIIVNAAAYTAVDRAEDDELLATQINGASVGLLGQWAASNQALVVHYSTDYVFDGKQETPYQVDDATSPLSAYGRSKLAGERALQASGADHLIFRTAWVYAAHGQNFLRTMLRVGAERNELRVVSDQRGAPTSTRVIVAGTLAAIDCWRKATNSQRHSLMGIHHLVASGVTSWHGFAEAIFAQAAIAGLLTRSPKVIPIGTAEFPTRAKRPAWSVLDNHGFESRFGFRPADWQDGLREVIAQLPV